MQVEVGSEDQEPLRTMAIRDRRSIREQGSYLLHLKIQEEWARLQIGSLALEPIEEVA